MLSELHELTRRNVGLPSYLPGVIAHPDMAISFQPSAEGELYLVASPDERPELSSLVTNVWDYRTMKLTSTEDQMQRRSLLCMSRTPRMSITGRSEPRIERPAAIAGALTAANCLQPFFRYSISILPSSLEWTGTQSRDLDTYGPLSPFLSVSPCSTQAPTLASWADVICLAALNRLRLMFTSRSAHSKHGHVTRRLDPVYELRSIRHL
ncbi:hypothetical protein EVG20_g563 [Dentipellis fragilis]|uniref:Uncharacterized protein n=1 Tax=Dentipellis fragilis TaxID=205917 RepID=A0A4Y9ZCA8_9AGAM|nr:hypothetical protein EVG20_g563 [Dentipellis fragilis]